MQVGKLTYYDWSQRSATVINAETLHLYRRAKALFKASRESLGSRELVKKLRKEGIVVERYRMPTLMWRLKLKV
jgi:putative transposase